MSQWWARAWAVLGEMFALQRFVMNVWRRAWSFEDYWTAWTAFLTARDTREKQREDKKNASPTF